MFLQIVMVVVKIEVFITMLVRKKFRFSLLMGNQKNRTIVYHLRGTRWVFSLVTGIMPVVGCLQELLNFVFVNH